MKRIDLQTIVSKTNNTETIKTPVCKRSRALLKYLRGSRYHPRWYAVCGSRYHPHQRCVPISDSACANNLIARGKRCIPRPRRSPMSVNADTSTFLMAFFAQLNKDGGFLSFFLSFFFLFREVDPPPQKKKKGTKKQQQQQKPI